MTGTEQPPTEKYKAYQAELEQEKLSNNQARVQRAE